MKATWHMWPAWLSDETCDQIIEHAERLLPSQDGVVGMDEGARHDAAVREALIRWVKRRDQEFAAIWDEIEERFEVANRDYFGVDARHTPAMQFTTYRASRQGHYHWHQDTFVGRDSVYDRKLSLVVQLSCPKTYEGGELELDTWTQPDPRALRQRGTIIVFPSLVHHRVTPIVRGTRHSLVAWKEGPPWQ